MTVVTAGCAAIAGLSMYYQTAHIHRVWRIRHPLRVRRHRIVTITSTGTMVLLLLALLVPVALPAWVLSAQDRCRVLDDLAMRSLVMRQNYATLYDRLVSRCTTREAQNNELGEQGHIHRLPWHSTDAPYAGVADASSAQEAITHVSAPPRVNPAHHGVSVGSGCDVDWAVMQPWTHVVTETWQRPPPTGARVRRRRRTRATQPRHMPHALRRRRRSFLCVRKGSVVVVVGCHVLFARLRTLMIPCRLRVQEGCGAWLV